MAIALGQHKLTAWEKYTAPRNGHIFGPAQAHDPTTERLNSKKELSPNEGLTSASGKNKKCPNIYSNHPAWICFSKKKSKKERSPTLDLTKRLGQKQKMS